MMPYKDKEAQRRYQQEWYRANQSKLTTKQRERRNAKRKWVTDYKISNPTCTDCKGEFPPHILQFDHVETKRFGITAAVNGGNSKSIDDIQAEIDKCEIVCANCHAHRTWLRSVKGTQVPVKD